MSSKKLTIVLSVVAAIAISAVAKPINDGHIQVVFDEKQTYKKVTVTPDGGGHVPSDDTSNSPTKTQIMQKAVMDLESAQTEIASMVNDSQKLLVNQNAFGTKMTQLKEYVDAHVANSSSCKIMEDGYKMKESGLTSEDQKEVNECYSYAENSLPMHTFIIGTMKSMLNEMNKIKNAVANNSIKAKMLEKRIISLTAAIKVMGE